MTRKRYLGLMRELHRRIWSTYATDMKRSNFKEVIIKAKENSGSYQDRWDKLIDIRTQLGM